MVNLVSCSNKRCKYKYIAPRELAYLTWGKGKNTSLKAFFFWGGYEICSFPGGYSYLPVKYLILTPRLVSEILLVNKLLRNHDIDIDDVRHPTSQLAQTTQQSIES